jgi:hypothetical protein
MPATRLPSRIRQVTELQSTITCPACGYQATETMPTDSCRYFYECGGCGAVLKPKAGHCCVFCSYGSVPCPPMQEQGSAIVASGCCGNVDPR